MTYGELQWKPIIIVCLKQHVICSIFGSKHKKLVNGVEEQEGSGIQHISFSLVVA
jgi:hypothetical protein